MKTSRFNFFAMALIGTIMLLGGCGISKNGNYYAENEAFVRTSLENDDIYIFIDRIVPSFVGVQPISSSDGYFLSIEDGDLNCYLPYFGRIHNSVVLVAENAGIEVDGSQIKFKKRQNKKRTSTIITFDCKNQYSTETLSFSIEIYNNGSTTITLQSIFRDTISYYGKLEKRPEKRNK